MKKLDLSMHSDAFKFIGFFILLSALSICLLFYSMKHLNWVKSMLGVSDSLEITQVSDVLAMLSGVPVSFAGAIVAILIAQRALRVSQRQEKKDNIFFIQGEVDKLSSTFWPLVYNLRMLIVSSNKIRYARNDTELDKIFPEFYRSYQMFISSLSEVNKSSFARECWLKSSKQNRANQAKSSIMNVTHEGNEKHTYYDSDDLAGMIYLSEGYLSRITEEYVKERKYEFYPSIVVNNEIGEEIELKGKDAIDVYLDDDPDVNALLFAGLLVASKESYDAFGESKEQYRINVGAALLADLIACIPSERIVEDSLHSYLESVGIFCSKDNEIRSAVERLLKGVDFRSGLPDSFVDSSEFIAKYGIDYITDSRAILGYGDANPYDEYVLDKFING